MEGTKQGPAIQLLGRGKVILEYHIMDPRIFLPEDYKEEYKLLDKVDFTLRLALKNGVDEFRFYYKPGEDLQKDKPTISIDLSRYIEAYEKKGGENQKAPCQEEEYKPDQRPKK
jgi:hypothetical protein